jgi:hypothetical protein
MEYLKIEAPTLSSTEIQDWISEVWILNRGIHGVPVKEGLACNECHYSGAKPKAMKDHFATKHQGMKWSENIARCNVQMPFEGNLKKYFQIEDTEGQEDEIDVQNDWKQALEQDYKETMAEHDTIASKGHSDVRLLSAFIAKMRWDISVKDQDLVSLQKLASAPVRSDRLHKVILCGRQYIEKCCDALNGGNMMVKRHLMSAG